VQNLQNGFEAGNSERPGNVLVPEEPLTILNAVPTWTKKQFYSEDFWLSNQRCWQQIKHVRPVAGESFLASLSPSCNSCQNHISRNADMRNSLDMFGL
jgi:hypothetical protein